MKKLWKRMIWLMNYMRMKNVVHLVTMPASGTHWLRLMLAKALVMYENIPYAFSGIDPIDIIPHFGDVESPALSLVSDRAGAGPKLFQSHLPYHPLFRKKKVILLVRDLRDSLVSHYESYIKNHQSTISFSEFLRDESLSKKYGLAMRIKFLNSWHKHQRKVDLHIVSYEDLQNDMVNTLARVVRFIGWSFNDQQLKEIMDFASLDNMKKLELTAQGSQPKANQGRIGRYVDYFSPSDKDYFLTYSSEHLLDAFGYLYDADW